MIFEYCIFTRRRPFDVKSWTRLVRLRGVSFVTVAVVAVCDGYPGTCSIGMMEIILYHVSFCGMIQYILRRYELEDYQIIHWLIFANCHLLSMTPWESVWQILLAALGITSNSAVINVHSLVKRI